MSAVCKLTGDPSTYRYHIDFTSSDNKSSVLQVNDIKKVSFVQYFVVRFDNIIVFFFQKDDITIRFWFSPSSDVILMLNIEKFKSRLELVALLVYFEKGRKI